MNWNKINRVLHRDFGYFFVATSIIYGLSGIALNHLNDWNPNYVISSEEFQISQPIEKNMITESWVFEIIDKYDDKKNFKKYYFPSENRLKIFLIGGSILIDLENGNGFIEKIRRRKIFYDANYLHYNPGNWWTWFSDIYAGSLILLAVTGLFILKGKNGIKGRGAWLTILGLIIPLFILYFLL